MNKRKKGSKYRGSKTHGGGSMKKRRGAGNRGGRGRAGSGKKGDCKKPMYWKEKTPKGFSSLRKNNKTVNISQINDSIHKLKSTGGIYQVDLSKMGYNKLLGTGKTKFKFNVTVDEASKSAVDKVKKAGGTVTLKKVVKPKVEAKAPVKETKPAPEKEAPDVKAEPKESAE